MLMDSVVVNQELVAPNVRSASPTITALMKVDASDVQCVQLEVMCAIR